jgi:mono/diheme cytochrome c family protein
MRVRSVVLSVVSVMLLAFAIGCAKQEPPKPAAPVAVAPAADGKTLFDTKCSVCHGLDRATARKETKEKWASIVKEMQGKKADWISDADASKIVDYLSAEFGKK